MNIYFLGNNGNDEPLSKEKQRELALHLLDYALLCEFGVKRVQLGEIVKTGYGKPFFKDSHICFNYSHCKYGAACLVSESEVGIDIESVPTKAVKPSLIKRVCCDDELKIIKSDEDFIKIWVQKEAYSKFTGKGLGEGFKKTNTTTFPKEFVFKHNNLYIACYCELLSGGGEFTGATPRLVQAAPP
ncbi:MAG: 4'-phosphopantetheinyl transferase superfamily protein [Oscillospiraceae bacterium]|nr:4'-phosphopantetheinyl transferase superfamily protein [Oscillospiraceae bacterium]